MDAHSLKLPTVYAPCLSLPLLSLLPGSLSYDTPTGGECQLASSARSFRADENARLHTDVSQSGIADNQCALRSTVRTTTTHSAPSLETYTPVRHHIRIFLNVHCSSAKAIFEHVSVRDKLQICT